MIVIYKMIYLSIFIYGAEIFPMTRNIEYRITVVKMKFLRRVDRKINIKIIRILARALRFRHKRAQLKWYIYIG